MAVIGDLEEVVKRAAEGLSEACDRGGDDGLLVVVAVVTKKETQVCVLEAPELEGGPPTDVLVSRVEKLVVEHLEKVPGLVRLPDGPVS